MALFWVGLEAIDVFFLDGGDKFVAVVGLSYGVFVVTYGVIGVYEIEVELFF